MKENFINKKFNQLTIIEDLGRCPKWRKILVLCRCDCGKEKVLYLSHLKSGNTKSCGHYQKELPTTHGLSKTPEYRAYFGAKNRCENPNNNAYKDYGGRGIKFKFLSFEEFIGEVGLKPSEKYSIDRINNDGHYEIGNVKWSTSTEQNKNQRKRKPYTRETKEKIPKWSVDRQMALFYNISLQTVKRRMKDGWCDACLYRPIDIKWRCTHNWEELYLTCK